MVMVMMVMVTIIMTTVFNEAVAQNADDLNALNEQVSRLHKQGKFNQAYPIARRYVASARAQYGDEHLQFATALAWLAEIHRGQGRYAEAEPFFKRSIAIQEKAATGEAGVASTLANLGALYEAQGRYADAEQAFKRALGSFERTVGPAHQSVATAQSSLAAIYAQQERHGDAERLYMRSIATYEKTLGRNHPHVGSTVMGLGVLYENQARYSDAELLFKRSLAIFEKAYSSDHPMVCTALVNLGLLHQEQGRDTDAETFFRRALVGMEKLGLQHPHVGTALSNLASLYESQGRVADAEGLLKRAITIGEKTLGAKHPTVATRLNNLGNLYRRQERYGEAEPLLRQALAVTENAFGSAHSDVALRLNSLANLYIDQDRYPEAEPLSKRALAIAEGALGKNHPTVGILLNGLALQYQELDRYADAEPLFERALAISKLALGASHPQVGVLQANLATLAFQQSDWTRSAEHWRASIDPTRFRIQEAIASRAFPGKGQSDLKQTAKRYWGLVKAVSRLPATEAERRRHAREMFEIAQWSLISPAATALTQVAARSAMGDPGVAALVREREDLVSEWTRRDAERAHVLMQTPEKRNLKAEATALARAASIEARLVVIEKRLAVDFPDYVALSQPEPGSVSDVQALLSEDEAMVMFLATPEMAPTPEEVFIWAVTKQETRWVRSSLGAASLSREVTALRCGVDASAWFGKSADECKALAVSGKHSSDKPLPFDHARAYQLYMDLFGHVQALVKRKDLLIVPSGPLTQLPFQVLITKEPLSSDHREAAWLARDHAITVLPTVASLKALRRVGKSSMASRPMIGFGNPLLNGPNATYTDRANLAREMQRCPERRAQLAAAITNPAVGVTDIETRRGLADLSQIRMQVPLPETADELCAVASDMLADAGSIYLGAHATEGNIKRLSATGELAKYRLVHFATHGVLGGQLDGTREPGLILTPPDKATEDDDGYLSASEIAGLKLDADWVILSACNTAAGTTDNTEALSGLARAFIYAQARALLVSHWAVHSDAATKLITTTVSALARDPKLSRAEALRRSMLALIDHGAADEGHPAYWAPFVLVGEGGSKR